MDSKKIGVSVAASWAWGTGFIVGMGTMQEKGLIPFLIWGVANISTLVIFGLLFRTGVLSAKLFNSKWVKSIALVLQCVIFVLNANVINNILLKVGIKEDVAYWITCGIGVVLVMCMYKKGLVASIFTDNVQMLITYLLGVLLVIMGICSGERYSIPVNVDGGIGWAVWSATILLTSPIGDMEMWQRAKADEQGKAFFIGAGVFSVYVLLIALCSNFIFTPAMNLILLGMMIAVCSATLDSVIVCFHEWKNKEWGTTVALILCVVWGVFKQMGIIELWGQIGVVRVAICVSILIAGIITYKSEKCQKK